MVDYVQKLVAYSGESGLYRFGLLSAAKAWALIEGRQQLLPEDVLAVLPSVVNHRLQTKQGKPVSDFSADLISQVAIP